jgi:hypothetical protein
VPKGRRELAQAVFSIVLMCMGTLFSLAFYDRYWRWRDCFNELGRCYDPASQTVYLEQAGVAWGTLAAVSFFGGLALLIRVARRG